MVILCSVFAATYLSSHSQDLRSSAIDSNSTISSASINAPQKKVVFDKRAILIKLHSNLQANPLINKDLNHNNLKISELEKKSIPNIIVQINQSNQISNIEKVFKGYVDPTTELIKLKSRFSSDIQNNKRVINEQTFLSNDLSKIYRLNFDRDIDVQALIDTYSKNPDLIYIEPDYLASIDNLPNDPYFIDSYPSDVQNRDPNWNPPHDYQWNIKKTNSSNNYLTDTSSVIVAVIDTGVDTSHPELGNLWTNSNEIPNDNIDNDQNGYIDDINGANTIYKDGNIADDNNHGTHVAGVISAKTNNNLGISGVTSNTRIMAIKSMNSRGYGRDSEIASGVLYAAYNGAKVINMSLGGSYSQVWKDALDTAISLGIIPVVSAGNGNNYSPAWFPASYRPAITVAAVDENLNKLRYSNYGPNIDVAAPGGGQPCLYWSKPSYCSNILSLKSSQNTDDLEYTVNQKYLRMSGTSMAAPHVSGVVALLLATHPQFNLDDINNYIRFNSINPSVGTNTEDFGWGVINSIGTDFVASSNIKFEINYPANNSLTGNLFTVGGQISADNFDHFDVAYRLVGGDWTKTGVVLVGGGLQPVLFNYPGKIASISLPNNAVNGIYEVKTTLYLSSGRSLSAIRKVNYVKKLGTNWLYQAGDNEQLAIGEIMTADLNNDGQKEIIIYNQGVPAGSFSVYDYNYNLLWQANKGGEVVVGNIDKRSPAKEVVVRTKDTIYVYNYQGQLINDMTLNYSGSGKNIMILDTDNNGIDELIFHELPKYSTSFLRDFEQNQSNQFIEKWKTPVNGPDANKTWPASGDLNGDGYKEIVVLDANRVLKVISSSGSVISTYSYGGSENIDSLVLADLDNDHQDEIIFHIKWGKTIAIKLSGSTINQVWSIDNSNNIQSLAVSDFNHDSHPDIYSMVNNSLQEQLTDFQGNSFYTGNSYIYWGNSDNPGVLIADRDNNDKPEIYTSGLFSLDSRQYLNVREYDSQQNALNLIDGDWVSVLPQWSNYSNSSFPNLSVAIDDLDGNGKLDFIIQGVGIIEYPTQGTSYYPFRHHDFQRTGSYSFIPNSTVVPSQSIPLITGWNWITLKSTPSNPSISAVLTSIGGKYDRVLSETGIYSVELPPEFNTLTSLSAGSMYLIHMTSPGTLLISGTLIPVNQPIHLHPGWNWIGYYGSTSIPINVALTSINGQYQRVLSQDLYYDATNPSASSLINLDPNQGYLLYSNIDQTLTYPSASTQKSTLNNIDATPSCTKTITNNYTNIFGKIPIPTNNTNIVRIITPKGIVAGCGNISGGEFKISRVFGQETINGKTYPGFKTGEPISLEIINSLTNKTQRFVTNLKFSTDLVDHQFKVELTPVPTNIPPPISSCIKCNCSCITSSICKPDSKIKCLDTNYSCQLVRGICQKVSDISKSVQ